MKKKVALNLSLTKETLWHLDSVADSKLAAAQGGATFMITPFCKPADPASIGCNH